MDVVQVGKWSIGLDKPTKQTVIRFDYSDRKPAIFAVQMNDAQAMARAILEQYASPPPARLS